MDMKSYVLSVLQGRRRGLLAFLTLGALRAASVGYALAHGLHRLGYALGLLRAARLPAPVLSVGNLTVGGTGKTPLVELVARRLARRNLKVAVLARGYGRTGAGVDDEDLLGGMPNVTRFTGADRVASARRATAEIHPDVFLLDDGFQHYRVRRDLEIVTVDATNPFGPGGRVPRGLLRDDPRALARADLVVLTRTDQVTPAELSLVRERVAALSGGRPVVETVHRPCAVRTLWNGRTAPLEWLKGRAVYAFCGLGNPESFWRTAKAAGADVVKTRAFPDHHAYSPRDLRQMEAEAQEFMAAAMLTSEKDATKIEPSSFSRPLAALRVELEVTRGDELLEALLDRLVRDLAPAAAASPR